MSAKRYKLSGSEAIEKIKELIKLHDLGYLLDEPLSLAWHDKGTFKYYIRKRNLNNNLIYYVIFEFTANRSIPACQSIKYYLDANITDISFAINKYKSNDISFRTIEHIDYKH